MLYRPVWLCCIIIYRIFYKHFFVNYKKYSLKKATILVSNHNNAFIDPIILPAIILQRLYFIVRGDIFNTPLKRWILWNLGQIPFFRLRDGLDSVKRNEASFEKCYDLLSRKKNILIFPEGDCVQEKRIRPLKKGTARMAFGAIEKYSWDLDIQLLPILNNYTYPREFRTSIMTNMGESINLNDYKALFVENENKAINKLTKDLHSAMKDLYVHIEDKADDELFEQLVILRRNELDYSTLPWLKKGSIWFNTEKKLADTLNELTVDKKESLKEQATNYWNSLKSCSVTDKAVIGKTPNKVLGFLVTLIGFPVYVVGIVLNIFQFKFTNSIADKKIKQVIFQNSIRYGIIYVLNLLIALTILFVVGIVVNWTVAACSMVLLWFVAFFTINYHEYVQEWLQTISASELDDEMLNKLRKERIQILDQL